jgi:hypothetical protein
MRKTFCVLALLVTGAAHAAYTAENYVKDCDKGVSLAIITLIEMDEAVKPANLVEEKRKIAASCATASAEEVARVTAMPNASTFATLAGVKLAGDAAGIPAEHNEVFLAAVTLTLANRGDLDVGAQERHLAWIERERNEGEAFQLELDSPRHHHRDPAVRMRNRGVQMCLFGALSVLEVMGQSSGLSTNQRNRILRRCGSGFDAEPLEADESFENAACQRGARDIVTLQKAKLTASQSEALDGECRQNALTSEVIDLEELLH